MTATDEGGHFQWNIHTFVYSTRAQLDAFSAEDLPAAGIGVLHPSVVHGQAIDVQFDRTLVSVALAVGFGGGIASGSWGCRVGGGGSRRGQGLADVFPVAMAILVAAQGQVKTFDAHVAHLHFTAQQGQHTYGQPKHLQVGKRRFGVVQGRDAGFMQLQTQPGEQAPANVAIERQLDVGFIACQLANLVFVVVGIEEVGQGKA
ncbi:hypothetical protein D3C72_1060000 [compost metagenome]